MNVDKPRRTRISALFEIVHLVYPRLSRNLEGQLMYSVAIILFLALACLSLCSLGKSMSFSKPIQAISRTIYVYI